ncbi:hypothetical protein RchiOBHm_Chr4g0411991 [Rosa chinensis]|uniref:Uncharacterized protein n=1 Tax=Rosa chinensis TaxID=74649 RepID=A0A2P6QVS0_ROSCH|nr:hypothetical protein RchiOBHm_Chr4g0411991 [Rosa chinensis]
MRNSIEPSNLTRDSRNSNPEIEPKISPSLSHRASQSHSRREQTKSEEFEPSTEKCKPRNCEIVRIMIHERGSKSTKSLKPRNSTQNFPLSFLNSAFGFLKFGRPWGFCFHTGLCYYRKCFSSTHFLSKSMAHQNRMH